MRKSKVKEFKKIVVLSLAAMFFATGVSFAEDYADGDWDNFRNDFSTNGVTEATFTSPTINTTGSPVTPVPGVYTITGVAGGTTINAGGTGITTQNESQILVNNLGANGTVTNVNFQNGVGAAGGAIQNATNVGGVLSQGGTLNIGSEGQKTTFSGNYAGRGGAIYNLGTIVIENTEFSNNHAYEGELGTDPAWSVGGNNGRGGAIFNGMENIADGVMTINNSTFIDNSSFASGDSSGFSGAIHNREGQITINNSVIGAMIDGVAHGNAAATNGGAIVNQDLMIINDSSISYNTAGTLGGAILNGSGAKNLGFETDAELHLNNVYVSNNYADQGGAIFNNSDNATGFKNVVYIDNGTTFENNGFDFNNPTSITQKGGAIDNFGSSSVNSSDAVLEINTAFPDGNQVVFRNNVAVNGGAIYNEGIANINKTLFDSNGRNQSVTAVDSDFVTTTGGAIYNTVNGLGSTGNTTIEASKFVGNVAQSGGAIANIGMVGVDEKATVTLVDTDFSGNKAVTVDASGAETIVANQGGAIFANGNTITNVVARNADVNIGDYGVSLSGNLDTIRLTQDAVLNLSSENDKVLNLNSTIFGDARTNTINVNGGQVNVNASIRNSSINIKDGMMKFEHDRYLAGQTNITDNTALNDITMSGGTLNLVNYEFVDQLRGNSFNLAENSNIMLDVNLYDETMDSLLESNFAGGITAAANDSILNVSYLDATTSDTRGDSATILFTDAAALLGRVDSDVKEVEGAIYKYSVNHISHTGPGGVLGNRGAGEYFQFNRIGNSDAVVTAPVAAQAAFLIMDNLYRQSFANMDMVTLMTPEERMAWKMRNKYANAGYHRGVYAPNIIPEERDGWYMRPFTNFESIPLKNGPKVSNVSYGTLIGGQSDLIDLGRGWDGNFSIFGAYHGSHQAYGGNSIWQNGGTIGAVGTAYKGNFWTGVTANIGASSAQSHTMFGNDNFPILMTGAAWKSGYNFGFKQNKIVIQPNYMMSYTFVNVFDYTNSAGVRITQDPLHAIEIVPGLRIIGNLKNGWQPYLACSMTWNIMDKTKFYANEVALTPLSIKPYFEYGAGLQKRYGDRFTGFGQAMLRNGGRNGIAFTLGFRWALGH